jgi:hypothetical protein
MRLPIAALSCMFALTAAAQDVKLPPEPKVQRIVVEDDAVRIEELRVRGQTQRIVVMPRNAAAYEIVPAAGGRDPSQNRGGQQAGAGGQRVWNVLKF